MDGEPNCVVERFDRVNLTEWKSPEENDARLLTMPNVPLPLHTLAPRTIMSKSEWDKIRKKCYVMAGWKCEICGTNLQPGEAQSHECYSYDFTKQEAVFERCLCLCKKCHLGGIHSGRALSMYLQGYKYMTKRTLIDGAENVFRHLHEWNVEHPDEEPLRAYSTFINYWKTDELKDDMEQIFKKYDAKFYQVKDKWWSKNKWPKWHLVYNGKEYFTPYENREDWQKKMDKKGEHDKKMSDEYYKQKEKNLEKIWEKMGID